MYRVIFNLHDRLFIELTPRNEILIRSVVDNVESSHTLSLMAAGDLASKIFRVINEDPQLLEIVGQQVKLRKDLEKSPAAGLHDHGFKKTFTVEQVNEWISEEVFKMKGHYARQAKGRRYGRY